MFIQFIALSLCARDTHQYTQNLHPVHVDFHLQTAFAYRAPDCVDHAVVLINGQYIGPIIRVTTGQIVNVTVTNLFENAAMSIHLHGMLQLRSPWADGTSYISNCPVPPLNSKSYVFRAPDIPGTFFYHGHTGLENLMGTKGPLLIDPLTPEDWPEHQRHDAEAVLLLDDWWHGPSHPALIGVENVPFKWPGSPDNILINGKGRYGCFGNDSEMKCLNQTETGCGQIESVSVKPGQRLMLRLINGCALMMLSFAVEGHSLTVVELDGQPHKPALVNSIDIHTGQRVAAILDANYSNGSFWITANPRMRATAKDCFGLALLTYSTMDPTQDVMTSEERLEAARQQHPAVEDAEFGLEQQRLFEYNGPRQMPTEVDRQIVLLNTQESFADLRSNHYPTADAGLLSIGEGQQRPENYCNAKTEALRWSLNRTTFNFPMTPIPHALYFNLKEKDAFTDDRLFYKIRLGETYDVVLQNYPGCNGGCESHPWHLHGHDFWVIGTWLGEFNGTVPDIGTGGNVQFRDTTMVVGATDTFPKNKRQGCGYTVIRFVADNPGAWAFHCHIEFHFAIGMFAVFYYEDMPKPDSHFRMCGELNHHTFLKFVEDLEEPDNETEDNTSAYYTDSAYAAASIKLFISLTLSSVTMSTV